MAYTHNVSDCIVRRAEEESEEGEEVRFEIGWLECEKVMVSAPGGHLSGLFEPPGGAIEGRCGVGVGGGGAHLQDSDLAGLGLGPDMGSHESVAFLGNQV